MTEIYREQDEGWERTSDGFGWRYILTRPLVHATEIAPPKVCPFRNAWLDISIVFAGEAVGDAPLIVQITVADPYAFDACTGVPDFHGTVLAAGLHDPIYQFAEEIVRAWWPHAHGIEFAYRVWQVLRWGDRIFLQRMRRDGAKKWVQDLYYLGVTCLGFAFHVAVRWGKRLFR